jgi:hypothetical protein
MAGRGNHKNDPLRAREPLAIALAALPLEARHVILRAAAAEVADSYLDDAEFDDWDSLDEGDAGDAG